MVEPLLSRETISVHKLKLLRRRNSHHNLILIQQTSTGISIFEMAMNESRSANVASNTRVKTNRTFLVSANKQLTYLDATHHQSSAISHQPSVISHQTSAISHQPSAISHQPSAISHQPSAISHQSVANTHLRNRCSRQVPKGQG
jgi:hypothetical protein